MKELKEKLILQEEDEKAEGEDGRISKKMLDDMDLDVDAIEQEIKETQPDLDELPTQEEKDNGMYTVISQEMRDTLQDIENLKSIIMTLKANETGKEDVINTLETIIDERTIHVGMLQTILDSFDEGTQELIDQGKATLEEPEESKEVIDTNLDKIV